MICRRFAPAFVALLAALAAAGPRPAAAESITAITHVTVISMERERIFNDCTVLVSGIRVTAMGPTRLVPVPKDAKVVDGTGKFLIPGLSDMHVHLPYGPNAPDDGLDPHDELFLYIARGVTSVRSINGSPGQLALRDSILKERVIGPTLYVSSPAIPGDSTATTAQADSLVRQYADRGYDFINVDGITNANVYHQVALTASELGIILGNGASVELGVDQALSTPRSSIERLQNYFEYVVEDTTHQMPLARAMRDAGTWSCPTIDSCAIAYRSYSMDSLMSRAEYHYVPLSAVKRWTDILKNKDTRTKLQRKNDEIGDAWRLRLTLRLAQVNAPLMVSPGGGMFTVPGFSLLDEMRLYKQAGLTPQQALYAATRSSAAYFNQEEEWGTIGVGHRADFVLLYKNPLDSLENLDGIAGVMVRGRWFPGEELERDLKDLEAKAQGG